MAGNLLDNACKWAKGRIAVTAAHRREASPDGRAWLHLTVDDDGPGLPADKRAEAFEAAHDDYSAIMLKALADRLAEAFAERLHQRVRTDLWGYAAQETWGNDDLIAERYQGIRPAPGYPACPDHRVKRAMFELLGCADIDMHLTESLAMSPAASVSGLYFAHPAARYFAVDRLGRDQVEDYARRKGQSLTAMERGVAPNLGYEV